VQPLTQNPAPLGSHNITFIEPPPLPSFMQEQQQSSGLASFGLGLLNTFMGPTISMGVDLSRAANNVLTAVSSGCPQ